MYPVSDPPPPPISLIRHHLASPLPSPIHCDRTSFDAPTPDIPTHADPSRALPRSVKLDSRSTSTPPPPLHYSPASSQLERVSSGESTPLSTPKGVGATAAAFPRKAERDRDLVFPWHRRAAGYGGGGPSVSHHFYADSTLLESELGDDSFPLFETSIGHGAGAVEMDGGVHGIGIPQHAPTSPRPNTSTLTSALQATSGNELRSTPGGSNAMSWGKPAGSGRHDSISMSGLTPQYTSGAVPITGHRNSNAQGRRESNAGSIMSGMSLGGISMNSWIRDE